jgi:hypothetical protein
MWGCGKSITLIGDHAPMAMLHAIPTSISNALSKYTNGEETHGNYGHLMLDVAADLQNLYLL